MSDKLNRVKAVLAELPKEATTEQVQEEYSRRWPDDSVSAGTVSKARNPGNSNGRSTDATVKVAKPGLLWKDGKRLQALAEEQGGMDKFTATVQLVDKVASQFGGFEALKAALKEVQGAD